MSIIDINTYKQISSNQGSSRTGSSSSYPSFFTIANDGEEALVRFMFDSPAELQVVCMHSVQVAGKWRKVSCLRSPLEPKAKCPLCASDNAPQHKIFLPLIEYTADAAGQVTAAPKIWERPASFITKLENIYKRNGDLSNILCSVIRNGEPGSMSTTYDLIAETADAYKNEAVYVKDNTAFIDYDPVYRLVTELDVNEMNELVAGGIPAKLLPKATTEQTTEAGFVPYTAAPVSAPAYEAPTTHVPPVTPAYTAPITPVSGPSYAAPAAPQYAAPVADQNAPRKPRTY